MSFSKAALSLTFNLSVLSFFAQSIILPAMILNFVCVGFNLCGPKTKVR